MALDKRLLDILCCPATRQPLTVLTRQQLDIVNKAISGAGLPQGDGGVCSRPLSDGLITRNLHTVYRIDDGIPVLLTDEAIDVTKLDTLRH